MSKTLESEIAELQATYSKKIAELQESKELHLLPGVSAEFQKKMEALIKNQATSKSSNESTTPATTSKYYRQEDCDFDLGSVVYDGDRDYFHYFMEKPELSGLQDQASRASVTNSKRELLKHALRLSPGMAPKIQKALDRCKNKLKLKTKVDVFVSQNPSMNAFCYPPHEGSAYILVTSALLEKLTEDELTYVIGHELGHFLYQHHLLNPEYIQQTMGQHFSPADLIRMYSWKRNAELTADRIGLICCDDFNVACRANFKISSGVSSDALQFDLEHFMSQYQEIESELTGTSPNMQDFYSSHPINPMRVVALDIFNRSETFKKSNFEYTEAQMENKIAGFMKLMEPTYLDANVDLAKDIKEILFLAGLLVIRADGVLDDKEIENLASLVPDRNLDLATIQDWDLDKGRETLANLIERVYPHLNLVTTSNIVRDLVVLCMADKNFAESEYQSLSAICNMLNIHPSFIDQVMSSIAVQDTFL